MAKPLRPGARMRWSDHELGLIKQTFAEQEELLILVRKFLLQGDMTEAEMKYLKSFTSSPEILAILKKAINPQLDKQAAPFQSVDLFSSMDLNPTPVDHAFRVLKARELAANYLSQQFSFLEHGEGKPLIKFDELIIPSDDEDETYIGVIARNFLLSHIDSQLFNSIQIIAGTPDETPEQQKKRLTQDSNK